MNTNFNAALNIAKSDKVVTKKEQCEAYEKMKADGLVEPAENKQDNRGLGEAAASQSRVME